MLVYQRVLRCFLGWKNLPWLGMACHRRGGQKQVEANVISLSIPGVCENPWRFSHVFSGPWWIFCWKMHEKYWKILENIGKCWKILENIGKYWKMHENASKKWWQFWTLMFSNQLPNILWGRWNSCPCFQPLHPHGFGNQVGQWKLPAWGRMSLAHASHGFVKSQCFRP